jgi:hypothetical protein
MDTPKSNGIIGHCDEIAHDFNIVNYPKLPRGFDTAFKTPNPCGIAKLVIKAFVAVWAILRAYSGVDHCFPPLRET